MKRIVMVNGVPASGKSQVARLISEHFGLPLLALDCIKEPFFDNLGIGDREYNRKLGRASYQAIFEIVNRSPDAVRFVVDAWFGFQPKEALTSLLTHAGVSHPIEVWCHAPAAVLAERYGARSQSRHPGHPGDSYIPELVSLADRAAPMNLGATFDIDTSSRAEEGKLLAWVGEHLGIA